MSYSTDRLYFAVDEDRSIRVGVEASDPQDGRKQAQGAVFGLQGQIALGRNFDAAAIFDVELTAVGLYIPDETVQPDPAMQPEEGDEDGGGCAKPRVVRARDPAALIVFPATAARVCKFQSKDGKRLALVQFETGLLQRMAWTRVLACRSLISQLVPATERPQLLACVGANWNSRADPLVSSTFFDMGAAGELAIIN